MPDINDARRPYEPAQLAILQRFAGWLLSLAAHHGDEAAPRAVELLLSAALVAAVVVRRIIGLP
jgi:hypothetical protein